MQTVATSAAPMATGDALKLCQTSPSRKRASAVAVTGTARSWTRLDADVLERHEVVRELYQRHVLLHRPGQRLLVQRDVSDVVLVNLEGLGDHGLALCLVGLALNLARQIVDLRVAVAAEVELALALVGGRGHEVGQRVVGVVGAGCPAQEVETGVAPQDLREVR